MTELAKKSLRGLRILVMEYWWAFVWAVAVALLLPNGCALIKNPSGNSGTQSGSCNSNVAVQAFQATVYPLVQSKCVTCHGSFQAPMFAVGNVTTAYNNILPYASLDNISQAPLISKMEDGHCGINCSTDGSAMTTALQNWRTQESQSTCGQGGVTPSQLGDNTTANPNVNPRTFVTAAVQLPNPMPTAFDVFHPLEVPLDSLGFPNAKIQVLFMQYSQRTRDSSGNIVDPGSYLFAQPRLYLPNNQVTYNVYLTNMAISIGTVDNYYPDFTDVNTVVGPCNPTPSPVPNPEPEPGASNYYTYQSQAPLLSTLTSNPMIQVNEQSDQILISFMVLQKATAVSCKNVSGFQSLVWNGSSNSSDMSYTSSPNFMMTRTSYNCPSGQSCGMCTTCHNANHPLGVDFLDGTIDHICSVVLQRITTANPENSPLILNPHGASGTGHIDVPLTENLNWDYSGWIQWIQSEQ